MSTCTSDIAKFVAGFAASESIGHWLLGIWGTHLFPVKIAGLTITQEFNWAAMGLWPLVVIGCVYLGWRERGTVGAGAAQGSGTPAKPTTPAGA